MIDTPTNEQTQPSGSDAPPCSPLGINSDSIVGACDCMVKSPNYLVHRRGCKYRLISERDEARNMLQDMVERGDAYRDGMEAARRKAEVERDKHCHPDHGGHLFPWENAGGMARELAAQKPESITDSNG